MKMFLQACQNDVKDTSEHPYNKSGTCFDFRQSQENKYSMLPSRFGLKLLLAL